MMRFGDSPDTGLERVLSASNSQVGRWGVGAPGPEMGGGDRGSPNSRSGLARVSKPSPFQRRRPSCGTGESSGVTGWPADCHGAWPVVWGAHANQCEPARCSYVPRREKKTKVKLKEADLKPSPFPVVWIPVSGTRQDVTEPRAGHGGLLQARATTGLSRRRLGPGLPGTETLSLRGDKPITSQRTRFFSSLPFTPDSHGWRGPQPGAATGIWDTSNSTGDSLSLIVPRAPALPSQGAQCSDVFRSHIRGASPTRRGVWPRAHGDA